MHSVRPRERAGPVRRGDDSRRVRDRADGVRREREGHHPRALADQRLEGVHVERHVIRADRRASHDQVVILRHEQPGRHVGVVVERRHHDLVTRLERPGHGVREQEVERGHVGAERDPLRVAAGELRGGRAPALHHARPRQPRSGRRRPGSRSSRAGRPSTASSTSCGHLRATRAVEVGGARRESRKAPPQCVDVEHRGDPSGARGKRLASSHGCDHAAPPQAQRRSSDGSRASSARSPAAGSTSTWRTRSTGSCSRARAGASTCRSASRSACSRRSAPAAASRARRRSSTSGTATTWC